MMLLEDILNVLGVKLRHIHRFMPDNTMVVCIRQTDMTFLPVSAPPASPNKVSRIPYEDVTMKIDYRIEEYDYVTPEIVKLTIIDNKVVYTFDVATMELRKNGKLLYRYNKYVPEYYFNQTFKDDE
jgi:hypothetical protein